MYRNIVYRIDKDNNWQGEIHLYTWDKDGHPVVQQYPHNSHLYYEDFHGKDGTSIFGTPLKRIEFVNTINRKKFIVQHPDLKYFEVEPPAREFLKTQFSKNCMNPDFSKFKLRKHYLDLEISVGQIFPDPEKAAFPINLITVYDTVLEKYFSFGLGEFENKRDDCVYESFTTEEDLLKTFLGWFEQNCPDVISGWNSMFFDIPYLIKRLEKVLPEGQSYRISPVRNYWKKARLSKKKKNSCYTIEGISHLDYLVLYRDKFASESHFSYKLDEIAMEELGIGKVHFEGKFRDFYKNHWQKFVEYNIRDVELLKMLDEKLQYIELARKICNFGLCEYEACYSSIPYIYNAIKIFQTNKNGFVGFPASVGAKSEEIGDGFIGAFVRDPKPGVYRRGVASIDLNSLYPNTMITLNISPETKFGKIVNDPDHSIIRIKTKEKEMILSPAQYKHLLDNNCTLAANNVLYYKPSIKKGIITQFLEHMYNDRKKIRAKMLQAKRVLTKNETEVQMTPAQKETISRALANMHMTQVTYKVFLNSIYGMLGTRYSPIFDIDNAEAITLTGQSIIKKSSIFIDEAFKKMYGADGDVIIYNDTDSSYFDCSPVVQKLIGTAKFTKKNIKLICDELDEFVKKVNTFCFEEIVKKDLHSDLDCIEFKRETFSTEAVFLEAKKKYILHVRDEEGSACDKFKVVGYETKKTEIPMKVRDWIQRVIEESLVDNWTYNDYKRELNAFWKQYTTFPIEDVAFFKGYSTEKNSEGFLQMQKGAGAHARAYVYYNQLLEKHKLGSKYEIIRLGDRARYCYITPYNSHGIDVIGFIDKYPEEFKTMFTQDYKIMFHKTVMKPLLPFCKVQGWEAIDPTIELEQDVLDL